MGDFEPKIETPFELLLLLVVFTSFPVFWRFGAKKENDCEVPMSRSKASSVIVRFGLFNSVDFLCLMLLLKSPRVKVSLSSSETKSITSCVTGGVDFIGFGVLMGMLVE